MHGTRLTTLNRGRTQHVLIALCCGSAFMLLGYDQGVMAGLLTGITFTDQFPEIDMTNRKTGSSTLQGTVVAIYDIGCLIGSLVAFFFGERLGRRRCIIYGCIILSAGAILQAAAFGIPQMIVGRIVAGIGNGMNTSTIPVYQSECSPAKNRGRALSVQMCAVIVGVAMAYWLDYGMSFATSSAQFRVPLAFQCAFTAVSLCLILFCPESPRWLLKQGFEDESRRVLDQLSRHEGADRNELLDAEFFEIKTALDIEIANIPRDKEGNPVSGVRACFSSHDRAFHRVMLGFGGQFMQQMSGVNFIGYYAPVIFEVSIGMPHRLSLLLSGINGITNIFFSALPIWLLDRVGRRKLMLTSQIGMAVFMASLAGCTSVITYETGVASAVMIFGFMSFFESGMLTVPWLLPSEYTPLPIRASAAAIGSASNWLWTYVVVTIIPISIHSIGPKTYIYFAVFNFMFIPMIYWLYPETKGLTLEEIDLLFTGEKVLLHLPEHMRGQRHADVTDVEAIGDGGDKTPSLGDEKNLAVVDVSPVEDK